MSIYRYGDRVKIKTNGTYKSGTVKSIRASTGGFICVVDFDKPPILIPQQMEIPEEHLESVSEMSRTFNRWIDTDKFCPICRNKWHEASHPIHGKKEIWKDCLKCNKTKEEIMKEIGK